MAQVTSASPAGGDPKAVSFADMPVWGDTSVLAANHITWGNLGIFNASTNRVMRNATAFNAAMLTIGAWISCSNAAGVWTTVFSTTGTKGKLFNVVPQMSAANGIVEMEVTIDGDVWVYSFLQGAINQTGFLGDAMWDDYNATFANGHDVTAIAQNSLYPVIMGSTSAFEKGHRYLKWTNDMQVRTRCIGAGDGGVEQRKSSCSFMYDAA